MLKKLHYRRQATTSKETEQKDVSGSKSRKGFQTKEKETITSSRRSPTAGMKQKLRPQSRLSKKSAGKSSSSRKSSSTASTAASSSASTTASRPAADELNQLLATQIIDDTSHVELVDENIEIVISGSGSDVTTGPVDDLLFAIGDAINKGANEVEDFVENKVAQGLDSIKNSWDRLTIGLYMLYGDNSTIATDFSDDMGEVMFFKGKGLGGALELVGESESVEYIEAASEKRSVTSDIKTQVQSVIDSFFLSEM